MPTEPRRVPVGPQSDAAARRLHIHGIKEMPAGYDAEVAELFRDLRSATALTEMDLATRLGTRPDVVQALEQGALYALPPWAETCRVVNAYGALLNLDVRPLLRRIYAQLEAGIVELQPKAMPEMPVMTPPAENGDFGYASGNSGEAARPNPLDIPWPPPDSPQRQQPQPRPQPQLQPQQSWPNAAAQPQAAPQAPRPNVGYQPAPQGWPHAQPQPQAPRPGMPQQGRPAMPQPGQPRQPQPRPAQNLPPQPHAAPPRQAPPPQPQFQPPQPQFQPQPQPEPAQIDADFGVPEATLPEPEPAPKRRQPLVKWALGALVIALVAVGLWFALSHAPGTSGLQSPGSGTSDPDDPRSRKADRLPDAAPQPAQ